MKSILALLTMMVLTTTGCQAQQRQTDEFKAQSGKTVRLTCIGHASIQIDYDGLVFHVDPWNDCAPGVDYASMPKANFILVTHEHRDHFDKGAIGACKTPATIIYLNESTYRQYLSGNVIANGDSLSIRSDIQLKAVPAYNTTAGREQYHPQGRDNGYILTLDGLRIYIAGDTEPIPEMASLGPVDIAFLPCNQPYTMTPQQLAEAARTINPRVLFPYHYSQTPIRQMRLLLGDTDIDVRIRNYQ